MNKPAPKVIRSRWTSPQEYIDRVNPLLVDPHYEWQQRGSNTLLENLFDTQQKLDAIDRHLEMLHQDLDRWENEEDEEGQENLQSRLSDNLETVVEQAEELFIAFPSIALSSSADEFLHAKILCKHFDRYIHEKQFRKIRARAGDFIQAATDLLRGMRKEVENLAAFLATETSALPPELRSDFDLARDLHSVAMDEAAAFFAGRGLEGTLRAVALRLRAQVQERHRAVPLYEMDFVDLGEAFRRLKWKRSGHPLIDKELKSLIDLLRTARNATAHPRSHQGQSTLRTAWQDIARLAATAATELWVNSSGGRRKLVATSVNRDW